MKTILEKLVCREDLSADEMERVVDDIATGKADSVQVGAFLALLRAKGETPIEIQALVRVMLRHCHSVTLPVSSSHIS
jgi:anthranilate phosphoribosyltransferase